MNSKGNATYLFERAGDMPHHSESFWTSLFGLFVLHLANREASLNIWQCRKTASEASYEPRIGANSLALKGIKACDMSIEPPTAATRRFVWNLLNEGVQAAGIRPDILLRIRPSGVGPKEKYIFIENKTTEDLQRNQEENYPSLIEAFNRLGKPCEFLLLTSVGADKPYNSALAFQKIMGKNFGLILWEDAIRQMKREKFEIQGIDVEEWQPFTEEFDSLIVQHRSAKAD